MIRAANCRMRRSHEEAPVRRSDEIGIPIIDLGELQSNPGDRATRRIAARIADTCRGIGFFYIVNHAIPDDLLAEAFEANRRIHRLPIAEKERIRLNRWHRGYETLASSRLTW